MKLVLVILSIAVLSFAADDGCHTAGAGHPSGQYTDAVSITVINNWVLPAMCLGIDAFDNGTTVYIGGSDPGSDIVQFWVEGVANVTMPLSSGNPSCFGNAFGDDTGSQNWLTDDWTNSSMYYTEDFGLTWTTETNPAGIAARGMDYDLNSNDYWCTGDVGTIWRFRPGVGAQSYSVSEVPTQMSGITVFPYMGDLGVALTTYNTLDIWVYVWDGSTLTYMGNAPCPLSADKSYGLTYAVNQGNFYWSYAPSSGVYAIAELDITVTSLSRDTWAGIKTAF